MRPAIMLFAKAPIAGRVKTRLQPPLQPAQAAELHRCFVWDVLTMLQGFSGVADVQLHTDIVTDAWSSTKVAHFLQVNGDLGARMLHALERELASGRPQAIILGGDAPTLPPSHVQRLLDSSADVALGPSEDGGYYAIACRKVHVGMFTGVRWSEPTALEHTVRASQRCGLSVELGLGWFDVDSPDDLDRLAQTPTLPPHTAGWFRRNR